MIWIILINYLVRSGRLKKYVLLFKSFFTSRRRFIKQVPIVLTSLILSVNAYGKDTFPIPAGITGQLFYLQRDPDANTVIYKLNVTNGQLNNDDPVRIFWIRYAEKGQIQELSVIQRKLAYGIESRMIGNNKHELRLVSYPKLPLYLVHDKNNYYVYTQIEQRTMILHRVYVSVINRPFAFPKVTAIELSGKDASTRHELKYIIHVRSA